MKKILKKASLFFLAIFLVACGPSAEEVAITYIAQTAEAATDTPVPTNTPIPTNTPEPTATATPIPYKLTLEIVDVEGNAVKDGMVSVVELDDAQTKTFDDAGQVIWNDFPGESATLKIVAQGYLSIYEEITLERGENSVSVTLERDPFGLLFSDRVEEGEEVIFFEDFQTGEEHFNELTGNWQVVEDVDNPGNMVIQIDQRGGDFASARFGPDKVLEDFVIEYKFRWIEVAPFTGEEWQSMGFSFWNRYSFESYPVSGGWYQLLDRSPDPWELPVQIQKYYRIGDWYTMRAEVNGEIISLHLNDRLMARYKELQQDNPDSEDRMYGMFALPEVFGQFDDIVFKVPAK